MILYKQTGWVVALKPFMIPAKLFLQVVFGGHKEAVKKAIESLMQEREFAFALMNL